MNRKTGITALWQGLLTLVVSLSHGVVSADEPRVVTFGDSTTAVRGKLKIYSQILREEIDGVEVINAGVGGHNTRHAKARFENDVRAHDPDVVVIQFGINDAAIDVWKDPPATESRVSLEEYETNLRQFVDTLADDNVAVILMTPNPLRWNAKMLELYGKPPYDSDDELGFTAFLKLYAEKVRELAREKELPLVDVYQLFETHGSEPEQSVNDLLLDGIHPNDRGQRIVAEALLPLVKAAVSPERAARSLFDGKTFAHWKVPEGDNGHWVIVDGVIDCDARSEAEGGNNGRSLWSEESFGDFELTVEWRIKPEGGLRHRVPFILPNGEYKRRDDGSVVETEIVDIDSGIYLRGSPKAQVNIWMWPLGSGELWGYRTARDASPEMKAACTPSRRADKARGEWNRFVITMIGDRVTVVLNGVTVIDGARLPGVPETGRIALQHHGTWDHEKNEWKSYYAPGRWSGAPSLVQFRNISLREF